MILYITKYFTGKSDSLLPDRNIRQCLTFLAHLSIYFFLSFIITNCFLWTKTREIPVKPNPIQEKSSSRLKVYWIGHATTLIRIEDRWILTDPNWSLRILTLGRHTEPGIQIQDLPRIHSVIVSHAHLDHLDSDTLKKLQKDAHLILPKGVSKDFSDYGFAKTSYVHWGDTVEESGMKIHSVRAQHFGGRWLIDNFWDGDPYTSYIIEYKGITVYFAGDTGYSQAMFQEIGNRFKIDLALIPVGPFRFSGTSGLGNSVHVNPNGALRMFEDLKAKWMIPMHFGTFYSPPEPEFEVIKNAIYSSPKKDSIFILSQGESMDFFETERKGKK